MQHPEPLEIVPVAAMPAWGSGPDLAFDLLPGLYRRAAAGSDFEQLVL